MISLEVDTIAIYGDYRASSFMEMEYRMQYDGGKNGAGVYQTIINKIPPHDVYIEAFLGSGAIMRRKRLARVNIGLDIDDKTIAMHSDASSSGYIVKNSDASAFLRSYKFTGREFVYCDPPYLFETRKGGALYRYEMGETEQHVELLELLRELPCMVMVSGYWSTLYDEMLHDWRAFSFQAQTRRGMATEWLWMNYEEPDRLHDYQYLGENFRQRERIKRKAKRWQDRLMSLSELERKAILSQLAEASS